MAVDENSRNPRNQSENGCEIELHNKDATTGCEIAWWIWRKTGLECTEEISYEFDESGCEINMRNIDHSGIRAVRLQSAKFLSEQKNFTRTQVFRRPRGQACQTLSRSLWSPNGNFFKVSVKIYYIEKN